MVCWRLCSRECAHIPIKHPQVLPVPVKSVFHYLSKDATVEFVKLKSANLDSPFKTKHVCWGSDLSVFNLCLKKSFRSQRKESLLCLCDMTWPSSQQRPFQIQKTIHIIACYLFSSMSLQGEVTSFLPQYREWKPLITSDSGLQNQPKNFFCTVWHDSSLLSVAGTSISITLKVWFSGPCQTCHTRPDRMLEKQPLFYLWAPCSSVWKNSKCHLENITAKSVITPNRQWSLIWKTLFYFQGTESLESRSWPQTIRSC